jgi:methionyl-tRNA formyltransferase
MVEKPDAGAIVSQKKVKILHEDTAHTLFKKLEEASGYMLKEILPRIKTGDIPKTTMDLSRGSYYGGRKPEDGRIFWERPAEEIYNLIRAVTRPYPGAFGFLGDEMVTFWWAVPVDGQTADPGMIVENGQDILIGTGNGCLKPIEIEVNSRVLGTADMIAYFKEHKGEKLA